MNMSLSIRVLIFISSLGVSYVFADEHYDEIQRRDLALMQQQLYQVEMVLQRLEQRQGVVTSSRGGSKSIFLDTFQLRKDLHTMQRGLDDYLSPGRALPRNLEHIEGDVAGNYTKRISR